MGSETLNWYHGCFSHLDQSHRIIYHLGWHFIMTYFSERIIFREFVYMFQFSSKVSNHNAGFCHWVSILWHLWDLNCGYWSCTVTPHQSHGLSDLKTIRKYEVVNMMRKYFKLETPPNPIEVSAKIVYILQHHRSKIPSIIFITKFRRAFVA